MLPYLSPNVNNDTDDIGFNFRRIQVTPKGKRQMQNIFIW